MLMQNVYNVQRNISLDESKDDAVDVHQLRV